MSASILLSNKKIQSIRLEVQNKNTATEENSKQKTVIKY